jgi:hypothetical protein
MRVSSWESFTVPEVLGWSISNEGGTNSRLSDADQTPEISPLQVVVAVLERVRG